MTLGEYKGNKLPTRESCCWNVQNVIKGRRASYKKLLKYRNKENLRNTNQ